MTNDLSDEDRALFRKAVGDIKPLPKIKQVASPTSKPIKQVRVIRRFTEPDSNSIPLSDYYTDIVQAESLLSYCSQSIPVKRFRELKTGQIKWDSRLDLHGLRPANAKELLIKFILEQSERGRRCLLIIHGKGSHQGEAPVLKNLVNHWLKQFPQVLAFYSALARDGGSGALYVLLKRQRQPNRD